MESNPKHETTFKLYRAAHLPIQKISYPGKASLKKRKTIRVNWQILAPLAAAAAIALFLIINPGEINNDIELAAETEVIAEESAPEEKGEEKKAVVNATPVTLKVIKGSKSPVPDSNKNQKKQSENQNENSASTVEQNPRMANLNLIQLEKAKIREINSRRDEIALLASEPIEIHPSSLSFIDMARFQYQRASNLFEEDESFIWNLAGLGIEELNKITGESAQILASKNEDGSISGFKLKSRFLNISAPIARQSD